MRRYVQLIAQPVRSVIVSRLYPRIRVVSELASAGAASIGSVEMLRRRAFAAVSAGVAVASVTMRRIVRLAVTSAGSSSTSVVAVRRRHFEVEASGAMGVAEARMRRRRHFAAESAGGSAAQVFPQRKRRIMSLPSNGVATASVRLRLPRIKTFSDGTEATFSNGATAQVAL